MGFIYNDDLGKFLLRVNVGFLMLFHGWESLMFQNNILIRTDPVPDFIIWPLAIFAEIISAIGVMLGAFARVGAFVMTGFMVVAILLRHTFGDRNHWFMLAEGGGEHMMEAQFFFLFSSLAVLFLGAGKYGLNIGGKWN